MHYANLITSEMQRTLLLVVIHLRDFNVGV